MNNERTEIFSSASLVITFFIFFQVNLPRDFSSGKLFCSLQAKWFFF